MELGFLTEAKTWAGLFDNVGPLVIGAVVSFFWVKIEKVLKALKELADVLTVITKSLEDKAISQEEMASIKKEIGEAIAAFKGILR